MRIMILMFLSVAFSQQVQAQVLAQWRGPNRNGSFPEYNLLKEWPESGPELLWKTRGIGRGYGAVSVINDAVFITGRQDASDMLTVLDKSGKIVWQTVYGRACESSYPATRCTPTVEKQYVYLLSGMGELVCIDYWNHFIVWSVPVFEKYRGIAGRWGIAESPLIVKDKVICTVAGRHSSMIALDKKTGELCWKAKAIPDSTAFTSAIYFRYGLNDMVVAVLQNHIIGINANTGQQLWSVCYSDIDAPESHTYAPRNNCITPIYHDGGIFVTSGYDHVAVLFRLSRNGTKITKVWTNNDLDCHHGQVVRVGSYIYGSNWIDNRNGNWCCVNWHTGKTEYEEKWMTKGSVSEADEMLYCYDEKDGYIALVEATPQKFNVVSSFQVPYGKGPHWTQPTIHDAKLYIRHDQWIMAYNLKKHR
ncbi:PQQ-binding-like beta-propeller repeat protein [bacterium]|nr:PQQ-binding-like beta-propeller repeat protein [bacterium]